MGDSDVVPVHRPGARQRRSRWAFVAFCLAAAALSTPAGQAQQRPPRVLLLAADPGVSPGLLLFSVAMRNELSAAFPDCQLSVEYLDLVYNRSTEYRQAIASMLRQKYADRQPDVVATVGRGAWSFALAERTTLFPRAKLLLEMETSELDRQALPADVAAIVARYGFDNVLDTAVRLLPATRNAVVILGSGPVERALEPGLRRDFRRFVGRVDVEWLVGLPVPELQRRLERLPADTVVIYTGVYRDQDDNGMVPMLVLDQLAQHTRAPIFGAMAHYVGYGTVGDGRYDLRVLGRQAGLTVTRLLRGATPGAVGIVEVPPSSPVFDARQLDRWAIPRRLLPVGSRVELETSPWRLYRGWFLAGATVVLLQLALLVALLRQRRERRRAETQQRELEDLAEAVLASTHERVMVLDRDGQIVAANRAWSDFTKERSLVGFDVGGNYLDAVGAAVARGAEDAQRTASTLREVLSGEQRSNNLEYSINGSGGEERSWYEMSVVRLERQAGRAVVSVGDVTDRHLAADRLRQTVESLPMAAVVVDSHGVIEQANAEVERLFAYRREELVATSVERIVPTGLREHLPFLAAARRGSGEIVIPDPDITGRRRDGSTVPVQLQVRRIRFGKRTVLLVTIADLSERRRMEAELNSLRMVTAHFARVSTVGEMTAAITHELNQPLTGAVTNSEAALRFLDAGTATPETLREILVDIAADGRRAGEVIQRLRAMLRKEPMEISPCDVNESVRKVARLVAQDLLLNDSTLDMELASDLPLVAVDPVQLQQVILNLILNGVDAMRQVPPDDRRLLVRTARAERRTIEIAVSDRGSGIAAADMDRLFEPFFTTKASGMGIGLAIVRSILQRHGGAISAANNCTAGATFTLTLPTLEGRTL